jgi:hypothetical protein
VRRKPPGYASSRGDETRPLTRLGSPGHPRHCRSPNDGTQFIGSISMRNPFGRLKLVSMRDIAEKN